MHALYMKKIKNLLCAFDYVCILKEFISASQYL